MFGEENLQVTFCAANLTKNAECCCSTQFALMMEPPYMCDPEYLSDT